MSEYLYCRRTTDHRFMQFKGLPKYNFRFKNAKKKSQARNRLLQYHVLSGPSIKKNTTFVFNQVFIIIISLL